MKGIYVLLIRLEDDQTLDVGKLGTFLFLKGEYAYVGSALGGLEPRIARHLRKAKSRRWHIDYFLDIAKVSSVLAAECQEKGAECLLARTIASMSEVRVPAKGFGSSDCRCPAHLFYFEKGIPQQLLQKRLRARTGLNIQSIHMYGTSRILPQR